MSKWQSANLHFGAKGIPFFTKKSQYVQIRECFAVRKHCQPVQSLYIESWNPWGLKRQIMEIKEIYNLFNLRNQDLGIVTY